MGNQNKKAAAKVQNPASITMDDALPSSMRGGVSFGSGSGSSRLPGRGGRNHNTSGEERPSAEYWINIGRGLPSGLFATLPLGIPLDDLVAKPVNGKGDFRNMRQNEANMLKSVFAKAAELAPGEEVVLNLEVRLRRRESEELSEEEAGEILDFSDI